MPVLSFDRHASWAGRDENVELRQAYAAEAELPSWVLSPSLVGFQPSYRLPVAVEPGRASIAIGAPSQNI